MEEYIVGKQQELYGDKDILVSSNALEEDGDSLCEEKTCHSHWQQFRDTRRCDLKLPFQSQIQDDFAVQRIIHLADGHGGANATIFNGLNLFYTAGTPVDVSIKSKKCLNRSAQLYRQARSADGQGNFLMQYASAYRPKKIIIGPIGKWICESLNEKATKILKGSLLIQLGDQNSSTSSKKVSSVDTRESNFIELPDPPYIIHYVPSQKPRKWKLGKWRSELDVSDQIIIPSTSTRFHQSELSKATPIFKGVLHCFWKNGIPYFVFFTAEGNGIIYANPWNFNASDAKDLDYVYVFHHKTGFLAEDHGNRSSHIVGKMKVSSCLSFNSHGSKFVDHEFVLYGVNEERQSETQKSSQNFTKALLKHIGDILTANHSNQKKTPQKSGQINLELENLSWEQCPSELHFMHPGLELAAIVVKDCPTDSRKDRTISGWGLKFLEKIVLLDHSLDSSISKTCLTHENKHARSISVLIPAGLHGGMVTETRKPSTLFERWSSGNCDCGGWDVGCPLSVLKSQPSQEKAFSLDASVEDCNTVDLFLEGSRQQEPVLRMVNLREGLYAVYFQSNLSALQSFSIAIASIHTQIQSLFPES